MDVILEVVLIFSLMVGVVLSVIAFFFLFLIAIAFLGFLLIIVGASGFIMNKIYLDKAVGFVAPTKKLHNICAIVFGSLLFLSPISALVVLGML
jgi:hypothetical protein